MGRPGEHLLMIFLSSHKSITIIVSIIMTFQLMTAVALDFCAEELELRGGREVGRYRPRLVFAFLSTKDLKTSSSEKTIFQFLSQENVSR